MYIYIFFLIYIFSNLNFKNPIVCLKMSYLLVPQTLGNHLAATHVFGDSVLDKISYFLFISFFLNLSVYSVPFSLQNAEPLRDMSLGKEMLYR